MSRTFSKVFGMAAMRLGCLFSHAANIALSAQGAVALQREYAGGAGGAAAFRIPGYIEELCGRSAGRARTAVCGPGASWDRYVPSSANFVLVHAGERAIEIRDALRGRGILVRDRSYEVARLRPHHSRHARADPPPAGRTGGDMVNARQIVFDMDGVLVDVTESYRETIVRTVQHFTGATITREQIQDYKTRAAGTTIGSCRIT